jgi:hypothetical protein
MGDPMRLVCLHADTVDALKRLNIRLDDLTPQGLWSSEYHLIGLTPDQLDALAIFRIEAEDVTPAQLASMAGERKQTARDTTAAKAPTADQPGTAQSAATPAGGQRPTVADRPESPAAGADEAGREPARAASDDAEVPVAQARDASVRAVDGKPEPKPNGKGGQPTAQGSAPSAAASQSQSSQQQSAQKGGKVGTQPVPQAQGRKGQQGQQTQGAQAGGQRYGTTRLRISVAGKYTEATVANGKIVVAGRSFDSPDQAAAELTKSRGDWTFWEYYDSTDGKWRMLTRDWDSVLKSATPSGR